MGTAMKITRVEPFIVHVPVTNQRIADANLQVTDWGSVGVILSTDGEIQGCGYTGTLGHLASDRLISRAISESLAELVIGEDPLNVGALWLKLYHDPALRWIGRAGIMQMALAAIDIALWDIKAKAAGMPLWKLLGGQEGKRVEAYNTDGGWINWSTQLLVDCAKRTVEQGFPALKLKVGRPDPYDDLERIEAVRAAVPPRTKIMVDGNGRWDLPTAARFGHRLKDHDVSWFEEPLWFDDVRGHAELARAIETPIALGGRIYSIDAFRHFIDAGAVHYLQPDVTRVGGITPWLQIADLAHACRLPIVPHVGDMMQVHVQLAFAHPACALVEYIPWLRICFEEPATVEQGQFKLPQAPGAGTTFKRERMVRFGIE